MAKKGAAKDNRSQREKFVDAAREHGADTNYETFRRAVRTVAQSTAHESDRAAAKNTAKKPKSRRPR